MDILESRKVHNSCVILPFFILMWSWSEFIAHIDLDISIVQLRLVSQVFRTIQNRTTVCVIRNLSFSVSENH